MKRTFKDIKTLYDDLVTNNKSFTRSHSECDDMGRIFVISNNLYKRVELVSENSLCFFQTALGGPSLQITGHIESAECIDDPDDPICEYRLIIEGKKEPLILYGSKKMEQ